MSMAGCAARVLGAASGKEDAPNPLVRIQASTDEPQDAYVAVR